MDDHVVAIDAEFWSRARRHLLKYGSEFVDFVPVRAEGAFLCSGRRVLDFTSGQMSALLGHSHPEIVATVRDGIGWLDHLFSSILSRPVVDLAVALAELAPQLPKVMLLSTLLRRSVAHQHVVLPVSGAEQLNTSGAKGSGP